MVSFCLLSLWAQRSDCEQLWNDPCRKYLRQIIREARAAFGPDVPYWLFVGQISQESRCNAQATAFDGGKGLSQFMPKTVDKVQSEQKTLQKLGIADPYNPTWAIRAMTLYVKQLYDESSCQNFYSAFRSYNGGIINLEKEVKVAESCKAKIVEKKCDRKKITLKSGQILDFCKVNIDYPYQIMDKSMKYKPNGAKTKWRFAEH